MNIAEWQDKVYALAKEKGWWDYVSSGDQTIIPEKIALIHSEASEALEVYRETPGQFLCQPVYRDSDGDRFESLCLDQGAKPVGFDSEMADVVIRVMRPPRHRLGACHPREARLQRDQAAPPRREEVLT